jgi:hypothetical protein
LACYLTPEIPWEQWVTIQCNVDGGNEVSEWRDIPYASANLSDDTGSRHQFPLLFMVWRLNLNTPSNRNPSRTCTVFPQSNGAVNELAQLEKTPSIMTSLRVETLFFYN